MVEGGDGSGKTTQVKLLKDHFTKKGKEVVIVEEPGGTPLGDSIRKILLAKNKNITPLAELLLYEASRSQLVQDVIKPALREGKVVIADRFHLSSVAYQSWGRRLPLQLVEMLNYEATKGLQPDLLLILDIPPEEGLKRIKTKDRIESEDIEFHRRVRLGYRRAAKSAGGIIIDGKKKPQEIFEEVICALKEKEKGA